MEAIENLNAIVGHDPDDMTAEFNQASQELIDIIGYAEDVNHGIERDAAIITTIHLRHILMEYDDMARQLATLQHHNTPNKDKGL